MAESALTWAGLPEATRELLTGKLAGLWDAPTDEAAFDSWPLDKKQALLLVLHRMHLKQLWRVVKRVTNVYGEGGVGLFECCRRVEEGARAGLRPPGGPDHRQKRCHESERQKSIHAVSTSPRPPGFPAFRRQH